MQKPKTKNYISFFSLCKGMKRVPLRSKELNKLIESYHFEVSKKDTVEMLDDTIILVNKVPSFFYHDGKIIPTLKLLQAHDLLKKIVVDMGAVKFVVGGADVMRPGIVEIDPEIKENEYVVIVDVKNKKPLAVGKALNDGKTMQLMRSGRVINTIHYVGDALWSLSLP